MCWECHRFARETKRDFVDLHSGPISSEILTALQEWRIRTVRRSKLVVYRIRRKHKKKMDKKKLDRKRSKC